MTIKTQNRTARIESRKQDGRTVYSASLSSELPVRRQGYTEILRHDADSINMERADNGLVLLFNHDTDQPIGRVNGIRLREDGKLVGDLTFSNSAAGKERQGQVDDGTLTDISIRYSIDDEERSQGEDGETVYTVTRFTPMEASVVAVPADSSVGIGRNQDLPTGEREHATTTANQEATPMSKDTTPKGDNANDGVVANFESARKAGASEGIKRERERQADINALFAEPKFDQEVYQALRNACLDDGSTIEQAQRKLLGLIGNESDSDYIAPQPKTEKGAQRSQVRIKEAAEDKQADGMRSALEARLQIVTGDEARSVLAGNDFAGMTMAEMARHSLTLMGVENVNKFDLRSAVGYALNPAALPHSAVRSFVGNGSSVFTALVENIANKQMQKGFMEAAETWRGFCNVGSVSSFRQESRVDLSTFSDLAEVPENGEYEHGQMSDSKEYIQAQKYGRLFSITREVIINEDLNALARIPAEMGRAAERKTGDLVYAILTGNPAMQDGNNLFSAAHANQAAVAGTPSVSTLDELKVLMAKQKGLGSNAHGQNIRIARVIVPVALETQAMILQSATADPDQQSTGKAGGGTRPNPFNGTFETISDARLDAASATKWYAAGDPTLHDTIEVAYLNGQQAPTLESENGFTTDGITYKVRLEVGVKAISHRALAENAGA
jgi:HK97 family phage prohead protease